MQNTFKMHSMLKEKFYFHHLHKTRDKVKTYLKHSKTHSKYTFFTFELLCTSALGVLQNRWKCDVKPLCSPLYSSTMKVRLDSIGAHKIRASKGQKVLRDAVIEPLRINFALGRAKCAILLMALELLVSSAAM